VLAEVSKLWITENGAVSKDDNTIDHFDCPGYLAPAFDCYAISSIDARRSPASSKVIALTIDGGPSEYTMDFQHILHTNGATATYFAVG